MRNKLKVPVSGCLVMLVMALTCFNAQSQDLLVKGVVMDRITNYRIVLAEITNKRTGFSVGSTDMGFFQIRAVTGDTLIVQKRDYESVNIIVGNEKDVRAYLRPTITSIDEVVIKSQSKKASLEEIKEEYKRKGAFYSGKPPVLAYLLHPLSAFYELFGRTPRNARRFGKYYATEMQQTAIDGFFNEEAIKEHTGLSGKEMEQFMLDYRPDYSISKNWNSYDAVVYIKASYKKYLEKK